MQTMNQDTLTDIRTVRPEWTKVMKETLLVRLTVGRWRARVRTDWQQLGLPSAAFSKAYTPGARKLLPDRVNKELEQLDSLARTLLTKMSYETLFGMLMPKSRYFEFKRLLTEVSLTELRHEVFHSNPPKYADPAIWDSISLYDRYFQLAEEIAANRDNIVDEVADLYTDALTDIWLREHPGDSPDRLEHHPWYLGWLDEKKAAIVASIPSAAYIRESFTLHWTLAEIEMPPEVVRNMKMTELEDQERALQRELKLAESERERAELERQQRRLQQERAIAEEIADLQAGAGARFEQAIDQIIGQVQGEVYDMVLDQLDYIEDNGKLHSRSVGRVNTLVDLLRSKLSGLTNDDELRRTCEELEKLAASGQMTKENSAGQVTARLRDIAISMKADLVLAGVPSRSGRELGIPDAPPVEMVRQARRLNEPSLFADEAKPIRLERVERQLELTAAGV